MHIVKYRDSAFAKYRDSAMSCAKTAELIKMQSGMLSRVGPGNIIWGCRYLHGKGHFWGVWPIEKQEFQGSGKRVSCAKSGWTNLNDQYVL